MSIPVVPMFRDPRTYRREALGDEAQIAKGHLPEEVMTPDFATDVTVAAITTDEGASEAADIAKGGWGNGTENGPGKGKKPE